MIYELIDQFKKESLYFNFFKKLKYRLIWTYIFLIFIIFLPIFYLYSKIYGILVLLILVVISMLINYILLLKKYLPEEYSKYFTFNDSKIIKKKDFKLFLDLINNYKMNNNLDIIKQLIEKNIKNEKETKKSNSIELIISILVSVIGPIITYFISKDIKTTLFILIIIFLSISFIYIIKFDLKFIFSNKDEYISFLDYIDTQLLEITAYFNIENN